MSCLFIQLLHQSWPLARAIEAFSLSFYWYTRYWNSLQFVHQEPKEVQPNGVVSMLIRLLTTLPCNQPLKPNGSSATSTCDQLVERVLLQDFHRPVWNLESRANLWNYNLLFWVCVGSTWSWSMLGNSFTVCWVSSSGGGDQCVQDFPMRKSLQQWQI